MTQTAAKAATVTQLMKILKERFIIRYKDETRNELPRVSKTLTDGWLCTGCFMVKANEKLASKFLSKLPPPGEKGLPIDSVQLPKERLEKWDLKFYDTGRMISENWGEPVRCHEVYAHVHQSPLFFLNSQILLFIQKNIPKNSIPLTDGNRVQWYSDGELVAIQMGIKQQ